MRRTFLGLAAALLVGWSGPLSAQDLPSLKIDATQVSVSGLSSGAFMTVQLHVAYSDMFMGAGVVAGGPYYCAAGLVANTAICMGQVMFFPPNPYLMANAAKAFQATGGIAPLDNLANDRVYIFSGTKDSVVLQNAVDATRKFYDLVGVPDGSVSYIKDIPAGHSFLTADQAFNGAGACPVNQTPYINKCDASGVTYDQAGAILKQIYPDLTLNPPAATLSGQVLTFDQGTFDPNPLVSALSPKGHVYVPKACSDGQTQCRLHVSIHGCGQDESKIGDDWYTDLYLNNWADTNNIVVLYPQVSASLTNPQGCWDWWGYTGPTYALRTGVQPLAITAMVKRLLGK